MKVINKMVYRLKTVFIILSPIIAIFFFLYFPYRNWKKNKRVHPNLKARIVDFKNNLTVDILNSYDIEFIKLSKEIADLRFNQFAEALKHSNLGGYSHPAYYSHIILTEKKEGEHFKIKIDFGKEIHNEWIAVTIIICDGETKLDGAPFRSEELERWAYDVGLF